MINTNKADTTISCRISAAEKGAFLEVVNGENSISLETYRYRPGAVLRMLIRAYSKEPEKLNLILAAYK